MTTGIGFRGWIEAADAARARRAARRRCSRARGSSRADPRRAARSRPPGSPPTGSPSPRRAPRSPRCCSTRASPGATSPSSTTAPARTGWTRRSPPRVPGVRSLVVYRWGPPPDPAVVTASVRGVAAGEIDAVVFTSAPGAHAWLEAADDGGRRRRRSRALARRGSVVMAAVGPITAKPLQDRGIEPLVPDRGRLGALVRDARRALRRAPGPADRSRARSRCTAATAVLDGHVLALTPTRPRGAPAAGRRGRGRGAAGPGAGRAARRLAATRTPPRWPSRGCATRPAAAQLIRTVVKRGYRLQLEEV